MANDYAILRLTDGQQTIDFLDETHYALQEGGWAPSIATRDRGLLGGRGFYVDVPETVTINVFGENNFGVALTNITAMLDQADAWAEGEDVDPVVLEVQIQNSLLDEPLRSIVISKDGDAPFLSTPSSFSDMLLVYEIEGMSISFMRRGMLLSPGEEEEVGSGTQKYNGLVDTISSGLSELDIPSPTLITLTELDASSPLLGDGFIIIAGGNPNSSYGKNFAVFYESDMTKTNFYGLNETTTHANYNYVANLGPSSHQTGSLEITVNAEVQALTVFVKIRISDTISCRVRARSTGFAEICGRWKVVPLGAGGKPGVLALGELVGVSEFHEKIHIDVETDYSIGAIAIESIAILPSGGDTHYIEIVGADYSSASYVRELFINHRALTHKRPLVYIETAE